MRGGADGADLSQDGRSLVTATASGKVRLYDNTPERQTTRLTSPIVSIIKFTPDGAGLLVLIRKGGKVVQCLLDCETGARGATFEAGGLNTFSPDSRRMIQTQSPGHPDIAAVYDTRTAAVVLRLVGHKGRVEGAAFSRDGRLIATGGQDRTARIWDATTGREICHFTGFKYQVGNLVFDPDATRLVAIGWEPNALAQDYRIDIPHDIKVFDISSRRLINQFQGKYYRAESIAGAKCILFETNVNERWVGTIQVRSIEDGRVRFTKTASFVQDIAANGELFSVLHLLGGDRTEPAVLDSLTGQTFASLPSVSFRGGWMAYGRALSPDLRRTFITDGSNKPAVSSIASGRQLMSLNGASNLTDIRVSPNGARVVTAETLVSPEPRDVTIWNGAPLAGSAVNQASNTK